MVTIWPKDISMSLTWPMKRAATASYNAVPSMLMVAPTGTTKLLTLWSIPFFVSKQRKVTGIVAELKNKILIYNFINKFIIKFKQNILISTKQLCTPSITCFKNFVSLHLKDTATMVFLFICTCITCLCKTSSQQLLSIKKIN